MRGPAAYQHDVGLRWDDHIHAGQDDGEQPPQAVKRESAGAEPANQVTTRDTGD